MKKRNLIVITAVLLMVIAAALTAGCVSKIGKNDKKDSGAENPIDYYCKFAADTAESFLSAEENSCYSPLSIYSVLSMAGKGLSGNNKDEVLKALECKNDDELEEKYKRLVNLLEKNNDQQTEGNTLLSYNSFWAKNKYDLVEKTKKDLIDVYTSEINNDKEDFVNTANAWVKEKTKGLIPYIFEGRRDIEFAFINVLYYEAGWTTKNSKKEEGVFKTSDGKETTVKYLKKQEANSYFKNDTYSAAASELSTGRIIFVKPEGNNQLSNILTGSVIKDVLNNYISSDYKSYKNINFTVPEFSVESNYETKKIGDAFENIGIKDLFGSDTDWGGIIEEQPKDLITEAVQKINFELNENGCKAGVASSIYASRGANEEYEEVDFTLDEPFVYLIIKDGVVLFIGTMCM